MNDSITPAIEALEEKLFSLDPQSKEIYDLISRLKVYTPSVTKKEKSSRAADPNLDVMLGLVFNSDTPVAELIRFAIIYSNKILKSKEIESIIRKFIPSFDKGLSTPIYKLKESEIIDTYNPSGSNHKVYYGLKSWFIGKNEVQEEYLSKEAKDDMYDIL